MTASVSRQNWSPSQSTQLLVIGGGVTGLGVALDACLRGLKVVVVELGDLGQGTSGRYHGLLHSGGRYILSDPDTAEACARENRILRHIIPHAIEDISGLFVSVPGDPSGYPESWQEAMRGTTIPFEEIPPTRALAAEPALNPDVQRAFRVQDAGMDSFELLHALAESIHYAGGQVLLRHKVEQLHIHNQIVEGVEIVDERTGSSWTMGTDLVINAAGPWAQKVAHMARIDVPLEFGKGTMVAMAERMVHSVINRCRPPSDGDIIVPVGTVAVLGTTDVSVERPDDPQIEPWEIDLLMAQADVLLPGIRHRRPLRAWAGVRPLYRPASEAGSDSRALSRHHAILDHDRRDGVRGLISVFGGKLTTYRLMAEETMRIAAAYLNASQECRTTDTPLQVHRKRFHRLPDRLSELESAETADAPQLICECEVITREELLAHLSTPLSIDLDDLRRDVRLGMGPCQGGFCIYRSAGLACEVNPAAWHEAALESFLEERWKGVRALAWEHSLRQIDLMRRIYLDLLAARPVDKAADD